MVKIFHVLPETDLKVLLEIKSPNGSCDVSTEKFVFNRDIFFLCTVFNTASSDAPLRFHCVGGCWDLTHRTFATSALAVSILHWKIIGVKLYTSLAFGALYLKGSYLAGMSPCISLKIKKRHYEYHMIEAHIQLSTWISGDISYINLGSAVIF